jgi:hypothetical protein
LYDFTACHCPPAAARCGAAALRQSRFELAAAAACVVFQFVFFARAASVGHQRLAEVAVERDTILVRLSHEKNRTPGERTQLFQRAVPNLAWDFLAEFIAWRLSYGTGYLLANELWPYRRVRDAWTVVGQELAWRAPGGGRFSTHSARSGGASAALMAGVPEIIVQRRGGWRSPSSMMQYVFPVPPSSDGAALFAFLRPRGASS